MVGYKVGSKWTKEICKMKFTKMHGAGNDFIIINNIEEKIPVAELPKVAEKLCHRRFSIGADGFMVVDHPEYGGDYKMRFYNSDGSLGEMCGNGARCIARYGNEHGLAGDVQKIETIAGLVIGYKESEDLYRIKLNDVTTMKHIAIQQDEKEYDCVYVELGDPGIPHVVVEIPGLKDMESEELQQLGRNLRHCKSFPKGANVNFYDIIGKDELVELTYERGVEGFTLACGTGTGSVVAALTRENLVSGNNVKVNVPGGVLYITFNEEGLFLTGPTAIVAEGTINEKELLK